MIAQHADSENAGPPLSLESVASVRAELCGPVRLRFLRHISTESWASVAELDLSFANDASLVILLCNAVPPGPCQIG